jgi:hypothetical protein
VFLFSNFIPNAYNKIRFIFSLALATCANERRSFSAACCFSAAQLPAGHYTISLRPDRVEASSFIALQLEKAGGT